MKGQNIYGGPAPEAMARMGEGIAQAYANVGKTYAAGYEAMGAGIAKGINSLGSSIADYKKMSSQVKSDTAAFNSFKDYLPAEFVQQQQALENDPKASLMDKQQFYQSAKGYLGAAIGQQYKMDQMGNEFEMQKELQRLRNEPAYARGIAELAGSRGGGGYTPLPPVDFTQFGGLPPAQQQQNYGGAWGGTPYR